MIIRPAEPDDLSALTEVLLLSFYPGHQTGWVTPILKLGLQSDLRHRLQLAVENRTIKNRTSENRTSENQTSENRTSEPRSAGSEVDRSSVPILPGPDASSPNRLKFQGYAFLVAVQIQADGVTEQAIVGSIEISLRSPQNWAYWTMPHPYLSNLAVHPDYRRQGVALQLLQTSEALLFGCGFREVYLHVLDDNRAARSLYTQAGYRFQSRHHPWHRWLLGLSAQWLVSKQLSQPR